MGDKRDERMEDGERFYVVRRDHDDLVDHLQPEDHDERVSRLITELRDEISQLRARVEQLESSPDPPSRPRTVEDPAHEDRGLGD